VSTVTTSSTARDFAFDIARRVMRNEHMSTTNDRMVEYLTQGAEISKSEANNVLLEMVTSGELTYKYGVGFLTGPSFQ
jgi:hypothetical protein